MPMNDFFATTLVLREKAIRSMDIADQDYKELPVCQ